MSSPLPGMPEGKPANTPCIHLDERMRCGIFHSPLRPAVCASLQPQRDMCGENRDEALFYLIQLENATAP
ncbi:YkgJ family cysteine cluster protein [Lonsdalea quercina]|uniref:YkgJ family cysteine cluster protein n=1 Tax=Lonsdalea quercina TaxID=71657 RepID=UPI003976825D